MFRPLRTLISLALLAGMVWFSFAVELGEMTLAEHVDRISETPEAERLLEGTRDTVNPAIEDVRDRMLGEYVEAPTGTANVLIASDSPPPRAVPVPGAEPTLPGGRFRPRMVVEAHVGPPDAPAPSPAAALSTPRLWPQRAEATFLSRVSRGMPAPTLGPTRPSVALVEPTVDPLEPELPGR